MHNEIIIYKPGLIKAIWFHLLNSVLLLIMVLLFLMSLWSVLNLLFHFIFPSWCILHNADGDSFISIAAALGLFFLIKPVWIYIKGSVGDIFSRRMVVSGIISSLEVKEDYSGESVSFDYMLSIDTQSLKIPKGAWNKLKKGDHVRITITPKMQEVWQIDKIQDN